MNVLVLTNMAPFVWGGAEELTSHLVKNLRQCGFNAEAMRIPFKWDPYEHLLDEIFMCKSLRVGNVDRVIALKFPAYYIPFEHKTLWILHQYRQAYDLWDAGQSNIPDTERGRAVRDAIVRADNEEFVSAKRIFAVSKPPQERLRRYNSVDSEVLFAPLNDPELFGSTGDEGYIAATGRINASKRQWMLIEALRLMPRKVRLVIAGPPDSLADAEDLRGRVSKYGLEDWVHLDLRFLGREELAAYVNGALAVAYLPFDEDSMGYVSMEASQANKPTITVSDSGGLLQLVRDGDTGFVSAPTPEALAERLSEVVARPEIARQRGRAAHALWHSFGITWPLTIERLMG